MASSRMVSSNTTCSIEVIEKQISSMTMSIKSAHDGPKAGAEDYQEMTDTMAELRAQLLEQSQGGKLSVKQLDFAHAALAQAVWMLRCGEQEIDMCMNNEKFLESVIRLKENIVELEQIIRDLKPKIDDVSTLFVAEESKNQEFETQLRFISEKLEERRVQKASLQETSNVELEAFEKRKFGYEQERDDLLAQIRALQAKLAEADERKEKYRKLAVAEQQRFKALIVNCRDIVDIAEDTDACVGDDLASNAGRR